jgi:hypothetical protein
MRRAKQNNSEMLAPGFEVRAYQNAVASLIMLASNSMVNAHVAQVKGL